MLKRVSLFVAFLCLSAFLTAPAAAQGDGVTLPLGKKLIEYGWDVPFVDEVCDNIGTMEKRPFDGVIFKLRGGGKALTPVKWESAQFDQDYAAAEAIQWKAFTHNFVIMWAASDQDWFDDAHWEAIENNVRLMAKAARLARCAGVCFDAEPYGTNPWAYKDAAHRDTKSFAEYETMVRKRGVQFIRAVEAEMPEADILTFFLVTYVRDVLHVMTDDERAARLADKHYALLPAFLNGMLEGAGPGIHLIDGNETAYYYTDRNEYFEKYHLITQLGRYVVDPTLWDAYRAHVEVGQALYIDQYFGLRTRRFLGNYMTPEERPKWFEHNVYWALFTTDKYVWCYSERMNWWKNENVPPGCEDAIRSARRKIAAGEPLGFDLAPIVAKGREAERVEKKAAK